MHKRFIAVLRALTPISHGDTHSGIDNHTNTRLFMRQGVLLGGRTVLTPHISENALRTVIARRPIADHLVETLGIGKGELPRAVTNLLYAGGNMGGERAPGDEMALGHAVRGLYPSLELLGGAVNSFILPPGRLRLSAWLVAQEYAHAIKVVCPDLAKEAECMSAHDMLAQEVRTRGTGGEADGNQMLYEYEVLSAGAKVVVEMTMDAHASREAVSALALSLSRWDGFIGGQGRQGRGRMAVEYCDLVDDGSYIAHIAAKRDLMRAGLIDGTLGTGKTLCSG